MITRLKHPFNTLLSRAIALTGLSYAQLLTMFRLKHTQTQFCISNLMGLSLGLLMFVLHRNQKEFLPLRFPHPNWHTVLAVSYLGTAEQRTTEILSHICCPKRALLEQSGQTFWLIWVPVL